MELRESGLVHEDIWKTNGAQRLADSLQLTVLDHLRKTTKPKKKDVERKT